MGNWIDGAAILKEVTQEREREISRDNQIWRGEFWTHWEMGDQSGDVFKLLDVDSTKESRAGNIHLDQSIYRWASWQGYTEVDEEIVWDEKRTVVLLPALSIGKKAK